MTIKMSTIGHIQQDEEKLQHKEMRLKALKNQLRTVQELS